MKRKITTYTLKKSTEHLYYEVWIFYQTIAFLTQPQQTIEKNILLDAFVIHTRNLFDFFYPKKKVHKDDMTAFDFIQSTKIYRTNRTPKNKLSFIVRKADKQVAHLTYTRNRYNIKTKPWPFVEIGRMMDRTISAFYDSIPDLYKKWGNITALKKLADEFKPVIQT